MIKIGYRYSRWIEYFLSIYKAQGKRKIVYLARATQEIGHYFLINILGKSFTHMLVIRTIEQELGACVFVY